ncbi:iron complex transport system ATP-binding protein [Ferrithrix thermotolerans DSM 19514]|uniref:Iron complex transport system ATP-binding protein n=1 Tax=Ferrithrix thermotolerans DSM 19514 TaxID=1121881 RepID=A0A1M4W116_9ACTN|nr:iron complex transport system ATP-binding protein [Ferrithrix thermotolerans DSM 19514]
MSIEELPIFRLEDAMMVRQGNRLLDCVTFSIHKEEKVVVMGRNGAGKSSFVRALTGFERLSSGSLYVDGQDSKTKDLRELRSHVSYIGSSLQDRFLGDVSASEVVLTGLYGDLAPYWHSFSVKDIERACQLLLDFGVGSKESSLFRNLSQGERQRTLLARAFATASDLVIADEPFVGLDLVATDELFMVLDGLGGPQSVSIIRDKAVLLVVHSTAEIPRSFDRVVFLRDGGIAWSGEPREFLDKSLLSELYGTSLETYEVGGRIYTHLKQP